MSAPDLVTVPREVLENLVNAKALSGVRALVAGWNGEDRAEPYNERHPSRLGATLPTTCGAVYELDEALQIARDALSSSTLTPTPSSDPEGGARGERADQGSIADARQCNEQSEQSLSPAFGIIDPDYARIFTIARCLAWAEGYAIAMHGSFTRDLDLIAVPWAQHACEPEHLAKRIESAAGLKISVSPKNDKPFGRLVWTMTLPDFGDPRFVDLSIIPRSSIEQDGQAELSEGEQRMIDLAWEAHKAARPIDASALAEEIRIQMNVRKTCVVSGVEALAKGLIEAFTITPLTKTPSVDHDDGNLRGLAEQTDSHGDGYFGLARERGYIMPSAPNHQPHAVSQAAAFVAWAMREGPWEGGDLDGGALQDKAEELGLIIKTTYNPDIHGSCDYGSEPGDDWFVLHPDIEAASRPLHARPSPAKTGAAE